MPDKKIDIRVLPVWLQYVVALMIVAIIGGMAWLVGRDQLVPDWMQHRLIPALGWIYLILLAVALIRWIINKRR
jgi:hypothetical protein